MRKILHHVALVAIVLILAACAPKSAPVSAPPTAAPQAVLPVPAPAGPGPSSEDIAWQKMVEAGKKEGRLTTYSTSLIGDTAVAVLETFRRQTGVVVENVNAPGSALLERANVERRAGIQVASVFNSTAVDGIRAKQEGTFQPMGYLPALADKAAWEKSPNYDGEGYIITSMLAIQSPWINTKLVTPGEEPRSWRDLLQPQWKGKLDTTDPVVQPATNRLFYYLTKYGGLDEAYFSQLGKQVKWSLNNRMSAAKVAQGEAHMVLFVTVASAGSFILSGAPMKAIDMEEGLVGLETVSYSLFDRAPQPNAARLFVNFMLSQEGQALFHKYDGSRSLRKDVPNFEPPAARLNPKRIIWTTPEEEAEVGKLILNKTVAKLMRGQ